MRNSIVAVLFLVAVTVVVLSLNLRETARASRNDDRGVEWRE